MIYMNLEEIEEKERSNEEIKNSLEDIDNFRKGRYKSILQSNKLKTSKLKKITEKAGVSSLTALEVLGSDLKSRED